MASAHGESEARAHGEREAGIAGIAGEHTIPGPRLSVQAHEEKVGFLPLGFAHGNLRLRRTLVRPRKAQPFLARLRVFACTLSKHTSFSFFFVLAFSRPLAYSRALVILSLSSPSSLSQRSLVLRRIPCSAQVALVRRSLVTLTFFLTRARILSPLSLRRSLARAPSPAFSRSSLSPAPRVHSARRTLSAAVSRGC